MQPMMSESSGDHPVGTVMHAVPETLLHTLEKYPRMHSLLLDIDSAFGVGAIADARFPDTLESFALILRDILPDVVGLLVDGKTLLGSTTKMHLEGNWHLKDDDLGELFKHLSSAATRMTFLKHRKLDRCLDALAQSGALLKTFQLCETDLTTEAATCLASSMPYLELLELTTSAMPAEWGAIFGNGVLHQLKEITFSRCPNAAEFVRGLDNGDGLPALRKLKMVDFHDCDVVTVGSGQLRNLEELWFNCNFHTRLVLAPGGMEALRVLHLPNGTLAVRGTALDGGHAALQVLELDNTRMQDPLERHALVTGAFPMLEKAHVSVADLTDGDVEALAEHWTSVETLSLNGVPIGVRGFTALSRMPRLKWLEAQGCSLVEKCMDVCEDHDAFSGNELVSEAIYELMKLRGIKLLV